MLARQSPGATPAFQSINLSARATADDDESRWPAGPLTLEGIPFQLDGALPIAGLEAIRSGLLRPDAVREIPVRHKARRLHVLVGSYHGRRDGTPVANVVLRFRDGETRTVRLAYGVHLRNIVSPSDHEAPLADPNSALAWQTNVQGTVRRIYRSTFDNPRPDEEIVSLDFVSLFSPATPVLFAVTLQDGDVSPLLPTPKSLAAQRAAEHPDRAYRRETAVRVIDPDGVPLTNAVGTLSLGNDLGSYFFGEFRAGPDGKLVIPHPPQEAVSLHLRLNCRGFASTTVQHSALDTQPWPESLEVRMERGVSIGGRVTDTNGQPVAGVTVIPFLLTQASSNEFTRHDLDLATTDQDGRWTGHALAMLLTNLTFEFSHPEHHATQTKLPEPALRTGNAVATLQPYVRIAGQIVDATGRPLPRATVILDDDDEGVQLTRTADAAGRFSFIIRDSSDRSATLIAQAPNLAPTRQRVSLLRPSGPLSLKLGPGRPLTVRLIEGEDRPVTGVRITLNSWEGSKALVWTNQTDDTGRFRWEHAPVGDVTFRFEKPGYNIHTHSLTLPASSEVSVNYSRPFRISGRVLDADSGALVENVRAQVRYEYSNGSGSTSTSGRRGTFSLNIGTTARTIKEATLFLSAPDYDQITVAVPPPYGSLTNDFKLRKSKKFELAVMAGTTPAPGAQVVLLASRETAYMDEPDSFRLRSGDDIQVVVADDRGVAALKPKPEADLALALHPTLGYAEVPAQQALTNGRIELKPWGRVQGVLRIGDKLEPSHYAAVHTHFSYEVGARPVPPVYMYLKVKPSPDGRFALNVPPGERMVQLRYYEGTRDSGGMRLSHNVPVTVKAGETNEVLIGGTGRTVTGKVLLPNLSDVKLDGRRGEFTLRLQPGALPSEIPPPLRYPLGASAAERDKILREHREKVQAATRNRLQANRMAQRTYHVLVDGNNGFRVPNVPPGKYSLQIRPFDPRAQPNTNRTLGNINQTVTVPEGTEPFDLGTFTLTTP